VKGTRTRPVRASLWDFFLVFNTVNQTAPDAVTIEVFRGLSQPAAGKALNVLQQNILQYKLPSANQAGADCRGRARALEASAPAGNKAGIRCNRSERD
jgi:hypothetical protein